MLFQKKQWIGHLFVSNCRDRSSAVYMYYKDIERGSLQLFFVNKFILMGNFDAKVLVMTKVFMPVNYSLKKKCCLICNKFALSSMCRYFFGEMIQTEFGGIPS